MSDVPLESELISPGEQLAFGCILAFICGVGYVYLDNRVASQAKWLPSGLSSTLSTLGVAVLSTWKVPYIGPVHGICWVAGLLLTTSAMRRWMTNKRSSGLGDLPPTKQQEFRDYISANLFSLDHQTSDNAIKAKRDSLLREHENRVKLYPTPMHDFIHCARDEYVAFVADRLDLRRTLIREGGALSELERRCSEIFETRMRSVLQAMVRLFEAVSGRRGLWVAVRVLEDANGQRNYSTMLRVGRVTNDRDQFSVAIPENDGLPAFLRKEYDCGRGIVVLGKKRKASQWIKTRNDDRREDQSVIAGPVVLKSREKGVDKREMVMILYVNSPEPDCFGDVDRDIMKCCTDVLSLFMSVASQLDAGTQIAFSTRLTRTGT